MPAKNNKDILVISFLILMIFLLSCSTFQKKEDKEQNIPENQLSNISGSSPQKQITPVEKYDNLVELQKKALASDVENKEKQPYLLKKGDKIEISVLDEPEMTREVFVLPDGTIHYLLIGQIKAEGKQASELAKQIQDALSSFMKNPRVSVIIRELKEEKILKKGFVSVLGAVQRPGKVEIEENDRLIDVITKAGGLLYINDIWGGRSVANLNASYISRNGEKLDVDLDKLLRLADMNHNILIQPGDLIYFAESDTSNIIVLGEVRNPNIIPYTREISLIEAISRCGGFTEKARQGQVIILRNIGSEPQIKKVDIDAVLNGREKISDLALKSGDIVFVPEQALSEYERYAEYLITFGDLILKGYQVREQIRFPRLNRKD